MMILRRGPCATITLPSMNPTVSAISRARSSDPRLALTSPPHPGVYVNYHRVNYHREKLRGRLGSVALPLVALLDTLGRIFVPDLIRPGGAAACHLVAKTQRVVPPTGAGVR
jgi:hypothetical protein